MARFERSSGRSNDSGGSSRDSRGGSSRGGSRGGSSRGGSRGGFRENSRFGSSRGGSSSRDSRFSPRGRDSGPKRFSKNRRDIEMTEVICSNCGVKCEVPFKPTTTKPVYCDKCFSKNDNGGSGRSNDRSSGRSYDRPPSRSSDGDLDTINEKLNKIMKALKIE